MYDGERADNDFENGSCASDTDIYIVTTTKLNTQFTFSRVYK